MITSNDIQCNRIQRLIRICVVVTGMLLFSVNVFGKAPDLPQVWKVSITGNKTFSDVVLENVIATEAPSFFQKIKFWKRGGFEYSETEVMKDVIRLEHFYQRRGFPDVKVKYSVKAKKWKRFVTFKIDEGLPIIVSKVNYKIDDKTRYVKQIKESSEYSRIKKEQPLRKGKRYEVIRLPDVEGHFTNWFKNQGYAFANVRVSAHIDSTAKTADLTISMVPGPIGYISDIQVDGEKTVSKKLVIRESGLKIGQRFSQKKLGSAQQIIFNQPLFRFVTINVPDQPEDSTVNLQINVREHKLRSVKIMAGFGTEELLRGEVSWTHRNFFGHAHRFTAVARASFIEQRLGLDYLFPYVINNKSSFVISPFVEHLLEPGYELFDTGLNNSLVYQYSPHLTGSISYEYTHNQFRQKNMNISLPDSTKKYGISALQFAGYYRQSLVGGNNDWIINPFIELSGILKTGTYIYQKISLDVRRIFSISQGMQGVIRLNGGVIDAAQKDSLPASIRFFNGGTGSVRGWYRQQLGPKRPIFYSNGSFKEYLPVGGRAEFSFNMELRHQLNFLLRGFGMAVFLDGGQIWRKLSDVHFFDSQSFKSRIRQMNYQGLQFGAGGGISYQSPIGPVRLDVGYKLNPTLSDLDYYDGVYHASTFWRRITFHFSIGDVF